jgi:predicted nuclease of predicted toxin-antitoxin system
VSELFIALYLDEDVDVLLADLIRARGFHVTTTREAGNLHADDAEQLAFAIQQRAAFVTHNRTDFEALAKSYSTTGQSHTGIIVAVRRPVHEIARRLLLLMNHVTADEMQDQLRYI